MNNEIGIGVCGWCLDRHDVSRSVAVAAELNLRWIQIGFFTAAAIENADWTAIRRVAGERRVNICGVFVAFEGEDYSSIARIAATGGLRPDCALAERVGLIRRVAEQAHAIGAQSFAIHAATIPTDAADPAHSILVSRTREVAGDLAEHKLTLLLETGRESAETLSRFLDSVDRPNVAVNFDPANFVVYGTDDPMNALTKLRGRIELVHLKDAIRSARPGVDYGAPAAFGAGEVPIARIVSKLRAMQFRGPLLIEATGPHATPESIGHAASYLRSMLS